MRKGLVTAMEAFEPLSPVSDDDLGISVSDLDAEAGRIELEQTVASDHENDVESAVAAIVSLESIRDVLDNSDGLNREAIKLVAISLEHLYNQAGLKPKDKATVALESFDIKDKSSSTFLVLEGLKETIRLVWEKIIQMIKASIRMISSVFEKVFGAASNLDRKVDSLSKYYEKNKGKFSNKPKNDTLDNEHIFRTLHVSKRIPVHLTDHVKELFGISMAVFKSDNKFSEDLASAMERNNLEDFGKALGAFRNFIKFQGIADSIELEVVDNPANRGFNMPAENIHVLCTQELLGGKTIVVHEPISEVSRGSVDIVNDLSNSSCRLQNYDKSSPPEVIQKLKVLELSEIPIILSNVAGIIKELIHYKACSERSTDSKKRIVRMAEKLSKESVTELDSVKRQQMLAMERIGRSVTKLLDHPQPEFATYVIKTCGSLLGYVEQSLKQYSVDK